MIRAERPVRDTWVEEYRAFGPQRDPSGTASAPLDAPTTTNSFALELDHVRSCGGRGIEAKDPLDLLADGREDFAGRNALGDQSCHPPQRGVLLREFASAGLRHGELTAALGVRDGGRNKFAEAFYPLLRVRRQGACELDTVKTPQSSPSTTIGVETVEKKPLARIASASVPSPVI